MLWLGEAIWVISTYLLHAYCIYLHISTIFRLEMQIRVQSGFVHVVWIYFLVKPEWIWKIPRPFSNRNIFLVFSNWSLNAFFCSNILILAFFVHKYLKTRYEKLIFALIVIFIQSKMNTRMWSTEKELIFSIFFLLNNL